MKRISRRGLLAGAGVCSVLSVIPGAKVVSDEIDRMSMVPDGELLHGCLFATTSGKCGPEDQSEPLVDFWSFRVSEIDGSNLPASVGRTVIWDDVFSSRNLTGRAESLVSAVTEWYGFDPCVGHYSFHLDGLGEIGPHVRAINSQRKAPASIALIDVSSCGLSRIDWPDILPHVQRSYDSVVGFAHWPGRREPLCERVAEDTRVGEALAYCDLRLWTDDTMLGLGDEACWESRSLPLNSLVEDLIWALSAKPSPIELKSIAPDGSLLDGRLRAASAQSLSWL